MSEPKKINGFDKYDIENAADTLIRAKKIRGDAKLFPLAEKEVSKRMKAAEAVLLEDKVAKRLRKL